jgi:Ca2+-binding RTX toxin-like protein
LSSGSGSDTLRGEAGNDFFYGGAGADTLDGGMGSGTALYLYSSVGVTIDLGQNGASGRDADGDRLSGNREHHGVRLADNLSGDGGTNILVGLDGNDTLHGRAGADQLDGGAGLDHLEGGGGDDLLIGGLGTDTFAFSAGFGRDVINDF